VCPSKTVSSEGCSRKTWVKLESICRRIRHKTEYHDLVAKLVTNSSPNLGNLEAFLQWSEPEKQSRRRDLAF
jgi:hypothetical protein